MRLPELNFIDDGARRPVGNNQHIGQRPIAAFGNSDGDLQMLKWTTVGEGARLGMIVHHTDAVREYAYDRQSRFGRLDKAMDLAPAEGWVLIDMKADWKEIFPAENKAGPGPGVIWVPRWAATAVACPRRTSISWLPAA